MHVSSGPSAAEYWALAGPFTDPSVPAGYSR